MITQLFAGTDVSLRCELPKLPRLPKLENPGDLGHSGDFGNPEILLRVSLVSLIAMAGSHVALLRFAGEEFKLEAAVVCADADRAIER